LEESLEAHCFHCFGRIFGSSLLSLFSLFWKNLWKLTVFTVLEESLEAHCFHYFLTDSATKQSDKSENSELPNSSITVKTVKTVLWSQSFSKVSRSIGTCKPAKVTPSGWSQSLRQYSTLNPVSGAPL
jgi:hypothetical protein